MKIVKKVQFSIRTKRVIGTVGILPVVLIIPFIATIHRIFSVNSQLIFPVYVTLSLAYVIPMVFFVQQSLKRKDQRRKAKGWLCRLIYSLDDTYERWSGRN